VALLRTPILLQLIKLVEASNGQCTAEELWTSRQFSPDFVDLVSYQGHAKSWFEQPEEFGPIGKRQRQSVHGL
jgi:hypothetical protein